ncbi:NADH-quinone oxidoreductase subunit L [Candidatus Bathycorpusculum sp.]|uniref:NADH-quinone oxidoreductase subunit 5 family protein n=1 Tax=Candidatus Bathycorpusculum sp. TaxID=2994959 RepID=UPI00281A91F2|nr:NADH-quinone oxidoreductase subunit L [Candidatus Termitimicrobium sp.]MCL2686363.1 NADH-quinone oxidoreductase subunit L [Candidatus Termitimicrobium sp.]
MMLQEFSAWFVWIIPLIASFFVPLIGKYSEKARNYFVIAIATVVSALAISLIPGVWSGGGQATAYTLSWIPSLGSSSPITAGVYIDPLSVLFACLVAFFALIITIYSQGYMKGEDGLTRYYYLLLLFIGSMIGLVLADNMLQMFIFWEMVGLCSYTLISFWYKKPESIRSGVKVFIMTRIGDIMLLAAIGLLFYMFGTFSFRGTIAGIEAAALAGTLDIGLLVTSAFLVLGGAVAKSAQFPLFTWLYSAMEAPTSISALLHAATMVKAGIYLLSRFILIFATAPALILALQAYWFPTITWIGAITAFIGASLAIVTTDLKGVLAYSTISQIGFMMAGLGAAAHGGFIGEGWFGSIFHMVSHAFFEGLGFLLAGGIIHALGTRDMRLMGGLRKAMPISFGLMIIMILTTSGLPPFAAFFSKGIILTSVSEIATTAGLIQTVLLFTTAALTFGYCIRMFTLVFMGKESEHMQKQHVHESPKIMLAPAFILAALCIVWGLSEPLVAHFLHFETAGILAAFTSLEFPIFLLLLIPPGLLAYFSYYKGFNGLRNIAKTNNPLTILLRHGYFFDDLYTAIAKGLIKISEALTRIENALFGRYVNRNLKVPPALHVVTRLEDTVFERYVDELGEKIGDAAKPDRALKLKQDRTSNYRNYLAAAVLGFILIVILIILTLGVVV